MWQLKHKRWYLGLSLVNDWRDCKCTEIETVSTWHLFVSALLPTAGLLMWYTVLACNNNQLHFTSYLKVCWCYHVAECIKLPSQHAECRVTPNIQWASGNTGHQMWWCHEGNSCQCTHSQWLLHFHSQIPVAFDEQHICMGSVFWHETATLLIMSKQLAIFSHYLFML